MKKLISILLCAALLFSNGIMLYAEDGIPLTGDGDSSNSGDAVPLPDGGTDEGKPVTPTENPPPPTPTTPPVVKTLPVDSVNGMTVIDLSTIEQVSLIGSEVVVTMNNGDVITHSAATNTLNAKGYYLSGTQTTGVSGTVSPKITVSAFIAPVIIGAADGNTSSRVFTLASNNIGASSLTVNGQLTLPPNSTLSGNATINGQLTLPPSSTLSGNTTVNGQLLLPNGGTLSGTSLYAYTVYATNGNLVVDTAATVKCITTGNGDLTVNANKSLQVTQDPANPTKTGYIVVKGTLQVNGTATAATNAQGNSIVVAGSLQAGPAFAAAGDFTVTGNGTATVSTADATGKISIVQTASMTASGAVKAPTLSLMGSLKAGSLTLQSTTGTLELPGTVTLSGELLAPGLTVSGNVSAGNVRVTNDINVTSGALRATQGISAGGAVTLNNRARSGALLDAKTLSARQLSVLGSGLNTPGMELQLTYGAETDGALVFNGGRAGGTVKAQSIDIRAPFTGTTTGTALQATTGGISGQALSVGGDMRARDNITLYGNVNARGVVSESGNITVTTPSRSSALISVEALSGNVTLDGVSGVSGRVYGRRGVDVNGITCGSIESDGTVNLRGTVSTASVAAGPLNVYGNVTTSKNVNCSTGVIASGAYLRSANITSNGSLTVQGNLNATDTVRGNPVTTPGNGTISAKNVIGLSSSYKGSLTIYTPFSANRSVYVELRRSGDATKTMNLTTDSQGRVTASALQGGSYSVYIESGSSGKRGSVSVPSSGSATLDLRSNAGSGSGGGSSGGFDEDDFWDDVSDDLRLARRGETVRISAGKANSVPVWLLEELEGRPVTLKLTHGRDTITINGENMYSIPSNRVFYSFDDLAKLYQKQPSSSSDKSSSSSRPQSSRPSSSTPTANPIVPPTAPTPPAQNPAPIVPSPNPAPLPNVPAPTPPSSSEESSSALDEEESSSEPESSEDESSEPESEPESEPADTKDTKLNVVPAIIAISLILVSLGCISVAYLLYRKKQESSFYDDDE